MKATQADLAKLLQAMEQAMTAPADALLIDLPGYALAHAPQGGTEQVASDPAEVLRQAHSAASGKTGVQIPFVRFGVSDLPFMYETRLRELPLKGHRLALKLLDRHDVVVSRILRGEKRELAEIEKLGRSAGLSYEGLIDSFCAIDTGTPELHRKKAQFLELIELLFGKTSVMQAEAVLTERLS